MNPRMEFENFPWNTEEELRAQVYEIYGKGLPSSTSNLIVTKTKSAHTSPLLRNDRPLQNRPSRYDQLSGQELLIHHDIIETPIKPPKTPDMHLKKTFFLDGSTPTDSPTNINTKIQEKNHSKSTARINSNTRIYSLNSPTTPPLLNRNINAANSAAPKQAMNKNRNVMFKSQKITEDKENITYDPDVVAFLNKNKRLHTPTFQKASTKETFQKSPGRKDFDLNTALPSGFTTRSGLFARNQKTDEIAHVTRAQQDYRLQKAYERMLKELEAEKKKEKEKRGRRLNGGVKRKSPKKVENLFQKVENTEDLIIESKKKELESQIVRLRAELDANSSSKKSLEPHLVQVQNTRENCHKEEVINVKEVHSLETEAVKPTIPLKSTTKKPTETAMNLSSKNTKSNSSESLPINRSVYGKPGRLPKSNPLAAPKTSITSPTMEQKTSHPNEKQKSFSSIRKVSFSGAGSETQALPKVNAGIQTTKNKKASGINETLSLLRRESRMSVRELIDRNTKVINQTDTSHPQQKVKLQQLSSTSLQSIRENRDAYFEFIREHQLGLDVGDKNVVVKAVSDVEVFVDDVAKKVLRECVDGIVQEVVSALDGYVDIMVNDEFC